MKNQRLLAFDESGNTGSDLLHKEQPVFILASVNLSLKEASELKNKFSTKLRELKFNRLKKYYKYHSEIISFLNDDIISDDTIKISVFHKEYCIWVHTVDRIIEPVAYDGGFDFYKDGLNLATTNLLYYCMPYFCDKNIVEKYKINFIEFFRKRTLASAKELFDVILDLKKSCIDEQFSILLDMMLESRKFVSDIFKYWDVLYFDSTLSAFIGLVDTWGRKYENNFVAYVDNSKSLNHFKHLVDKLKDEAIVKQEIGADRRSLHLPLRLTDIKFVDSKDNSVVQIADLIAGVANHYYRALAIESYGDDLSKMIGESKFASLLHHRVWPHKAFTPDDLNIKDNCSKNALDSIIIHL